MDGTQPAVVREWMGDSSVSIRCAFLAAEMHEMHKHPVTFVGREEVEYCCQDPESG